MRNRVGWESACVIALEGGLVPRLRNNVNFAAGVLSPIGLFALAVLPGLGQTFEGLELLGWCAGFWALSCALYTFLARPYVELGSDLVEVRNPLSRWHIPRELIQDVMVGASNYPYLHLGDQKVRIWALEESLLTTMGGGFDKVETLRSASSEGHGATPATWERDVLDVPLALITIAWLAYFLVSVITL